MYMRRKYSSEFKRCAVEHVRQPGVSCAEPPRVSWRLFRVSQALIA